MKNIFSALLLVSIIISCNQPKKTETNKTTTPVVISEKKSKPSIKIDYKTDSIQLRAIYSEALINGACYSWLEDLTTNIAGRLSGSSEAAKAVKWGEYLMNDLKLDKVWLQSCMVPHWVRGKKEEAYFEVSGLKVDVPICALGGSIATSTEGLKGEVIEVQSLEEAKELGEKLRGKIVFFNRPFDATKINTFAAYGGCVDQRYSGAKVVGENGAIGAIVRSMSLKIDDYPHTGAMSYGDIPKEQHVPTAAISTKAADELSKVLKTNKNVQFYFKQSCKTLLDKESFNVIGELKGTEYPDKYITIGGHLDSWDLGQGAHDDGAGIVQSLEVLRLFKELNIKPKHTLRVVFFMNEENGLRGGKKYAEEAKNNNEIHVAALESDAGGHTPRGFSFDVNQENYNLFMSWKPLFEPYGLHDLKKGGSGADIGPLKSETISLIGYRPDTQRYFDYHHAATDTFDKINKRELELGAASMTSFVYLLDKYLE